MTSVCELNVSHNMIKEIPVGLGRVGTLKKLYLSHNLISLVPEELGIAQILEVLDLRYGKVKVHIIEDSLGKIKSLYATLNHTKIWV